MCTCLFLLGDVRVLGFGLGQKKTAGGSRGYILLQTMLNTISAHYRPVGVMVRCR